MKDLGLWLVGSVILSPVLLLILCASILAFFFAVVYGAGIIYSVKLMPDFWAKWWKINYRYSQILEFEGNSTKQVR